MSKYTEMLFYYLHLKILTENGQKIANQSYDFQSTSHAMGCLPYGLAKP